MKAQYEHEEYFGVIRIARLRKKIRSTVKNIRKSGVRFDSIAFCGNSGALVAPAVALRLNKHLILVRKGKSHSRLKVEGFAGSTSYIILDDLISRGITARRIVKNVRKFCGAKCVGLYTYSNHVFVTRPSVMKEKIFGFKNSGAL